MSSNILEVKTFGKRVVRAGINLDGKPIGHAHRITPTSWTVFADLFDAKGDYVRSYTAIGQPSAQAAAEHLRDIVLAVRGGAR